MTQIFFETSDKQKFEVDKNIIVRSELVKDLLEDCDGTSRDSPTSLASISGLCFENIISWCIRNKDNQGKRLEELEGDDIFSRMDREELFEMMNAINYLSIPDMLQMICKHVASRLNNMKVEEISVYLDLPIIDYDKLIAEKRQREKDSLASIQSA